MLKRLRKLCRDERGMSFAFVGVGLMTFMAATTLAVDVGMFMTARTQAQTSADAGALSGVTALVYNSWTDRGPTGPAVQSSISSAQQNNVMGGVVSVQTGDVTFPVDSFGQSNEVKVNVFRSAARSNPVRTLLGSLLGISSIDIVATATAQASPAGGMTCVKPFIIPDKWQENNNPPYNMSSTFDMYDNQGNPIPNADVYDPRYGYSGLDKGTQVILRAGSGNNIQPSFYFSWDIPGGSGGSWFRDNIANCNTTVVDLGFVATQEPGNMVGPTTQGLRDLIDQDSNAYWDSTNNKVVSTMNPSPRVFPIPLYNPYEYEEGKHNGRNATLIVSNWLGFFLEDVQGNQAIGRVCPITGSYAATSPAPTNPLAYVIRLVQ